MGKFIQYCTGASLYDGTFDSSGWPAAGMGYIIVTESGRLIVVDGGFGSDAEALLALMEEQSGGKKPEAALWIITHPHMDHYGAIQAIGRNPALADRVRIGKIVYRFPMEFADKAGNPGMLEQPERDLAEICAATGAEAHCPERDELLDVDGMIVRFLYVPDDCSILNTAGGNANCCSLIFTVQGKEKTALITGDAYARSMQITAWRYAGQLKCDIMQMPHHALCDAYCQDFLRFADPKTLLMPISRAGYRAMHSDMYAYSTGGAVNLAAEAKAEQVYKAFEGTVTLPL
jgi:glyoxylase-like metal-dependent hydrolase (beta-lactamase superfamily II)